MINFLKDAIDFAFDQPRVHSALEARNHPEDYQPYDIHAKVYNSSKYDHLIRINFDYMRKSTYAVSREDLSVVIGMRDGEFELLEMKAVHEVDDC